MNRDFLKSRILAAAAIVALGTALSACGPRVYAGGNKPLPSDIAKIKPGEQTRSQVQQALGSPSSRSLYGEETWFYISETQEVVAFFAPEETERNVVAIAFDQQGVVKSVRQLGLDDGEAVAFSEKTTPTAGHNMTIIEQMVGNIGRFNAGETKKGGGMQ